MSKIIKVEDQVYQELDKLRDRGDTFSRVIEQLLTARRRLLEVINSLESYLKIDKWREDRRREIHEHENAAAVVSTAKKRKEVWEDHDP